MPLSSQAAGGACGCLRPALCWADEGHGHFCHHRQLTAPVLDGPVPFPRCLSRQGLSLCQLRHWWLLMARSRGAAFTASFARLWLCFSSPSHVPHHEPTSLGPAAAVRPKEQPSVRLYRPMMLPDPWAAARQNSSPGVTGEGKDTSQPWAIPAALSGMQGSASASPLARGENKGGHLRQRELPLPDAQRRG